MNNSGIDCREHQPVESKTEADIKRQIYEKIRRVFEMQGGGNGEASFFSELNPDIIVISSDQTLLFEPQNVRASEVLRQHCGMNVETIEVGEQIHVHPLRSQTIIAELRTAGLHVVC